MPKRRNLVSQRQALLQQKRGKNDQKNLRRKIEKVSILKRMPQKARSFLKLDNSMFTFKIIHLF